jgi:hypothetical protein
VADLGAALAACIGRAGLAGAPALATLGRSSAFPQFSALGLLAYYTVGAIITLWGITVILTVGPRRSASKLAQREPS